MTDPTKTKHREWMQGNWKLAMLSVIYMLENCENDGVNPDLGYCRDLLQTALKADCTWPYLKSEY